MIQGVDRDNRLFLPCQGLYALNPGIGIQEALNMWEQRGGKISGLQAAVGADKQGLPQLVLQ